MVEPREVDRLTRLFEVQEAEKRGAKQALLDRAEEDERKVEEDERKEKASERARQRWAFYLAIIIAFCSGGTWLLGHYTK